MFSQPNLRQPTQKKYISAPEGLSIIGSNRPSITTGHIYNLSHKIFKRQRGKNLLELLRLMRIPFQYHNKKHQREFDLVLYEAITLLEKDDDSMTRSAVYRLLYDFRNYLTSDEI